MTIALRALRAMGSSPRVEESIDLCIDGHAYAIVLPVHSEKDGSLHFGSWLGLGLGCACSGSVVELVVDFGAWEVVIL